ncbi:hypothetical protein LVJ83_11420 [Uruburuella testudinis]|uniref:Uncharacterized protein n=1 Tax=Uruburuella testudinis TaxID=1282863 RepID=A0ABY4DR57_9NEIS|nr:hypothetical protein [Uruburuella testudinis]UOO81528.1 hypothetical protein LVJ83_11420 [Uruburuella testudinis]
MNRRIFLISFALSAALTAWPAAAMAPERPAPTDWAQTFERHTSSMTLQPAGEAPLQLAGARSINKKIADHLEKSRRTRESKRLVREQQKREQQKREQEKQAQQAAASQ